MTPGQLAIFRNNVQPLTLANPVNTLLDLFLRARDMLAWVLELHPDLE